jgi:hypothetical protein
MINTKLGCNSIASNIAHLLLKSKLLKKFIKIFYYKEPNTNFEDSLNLEKRNNELSDDSDVSHESFKNSRSSKMSNHRESKGNCQVGVLSVFKKT